MSIILSCNDNFILWSNDMKTIRTIILTTICLVVIVGILGGVAFYDHRQQNKMIAKVMEDSAIRVVARVNTTVDVLLLNRLSLTNIRQSLTENDTDAAVTYCDYAIALHKEIKKTNDFGGVFVSFLILIDSLKENINDSNKTEYPCFIRILDCCIKLQDETIVELRGLKATATNLLI